MINRSEIGRTVEPGMVLEMSIDVRRSTAFHDTRGKCPRCRHINLNAIVSNGWVEWQVTLNFVMYMLIINATICSCKCSGNFQIAEYDSEENGDGDDERVPLASGNVDEDLSDDVEVDNDEITSPAMYAILLLLLLLMILMTGCEQSNERCKKDTAG